RAEPKPYGGSRPGIMKCRASPPRRAFPLQKYQALFFSGPPVSPAWAAPPAAAVQALAPGHRRGLRVSTACVIIFRPTRREAEDYHHYCVVEQADWSAVDNLLALRNITPQTVAPEEFARQRSEFAHGNSGLPIVGDPDHVARTLTELSAAGLTGVAVS